MPVSLVDGAINNTPSSSGMVTLVSSSQMPILPDTQVEYTLIHTQKLLLEKTIKLNQANTQNEQLEREYK